MVGVNVLVQRLLELGHLLDRDVVHQASCARVDAEELLVQRERLVLGLLEQLLKPRAAFQLAPRVGVQLRCAELRERLQLSELGHVQTKLPHHLPHRLALGGAAHSRDGDAGVHRWPDALVEEIGLEEDLPVRNRNDVRRDVGGDVIRLCFDDGQCGERTAAFLVRHLGRALQEPAVEIEDIAWVRFPARRPPQQQRDLPVRPSMLGEVVVDDQSVAPLLHEELTHRAARVWRDELERGRIGGARDDDDGVLHRPVLFQHADELRHLRGLLTDGDVDADQVAALLV